MLLWYIYTCVHILHSAAQLLAAEQESCTILMNGIWCVVNVTELALAGAVPV